MVIASKQSVNHYKKHAGSQLIKTANKGNILM